ncbi:MAG: ATP-binding protein [Candidatus Omnitrophota bacterium]
MDILSQDTELRKFLNLSLARFLSLVGARSGSIFLLDEKKKVLVLAVSENSRGMRLEGITKKIGEGISGKVALSRTPLLVKDINASPYLTYSSEIDRYQSNSFLSCPLEFSGDLVGVINITDRVGGEAFCDEDLLSVFNICKYLGIAIHSLKRHLENQQQLTRTLKNQVDAMHRTIEHSRNFSSLGKLAGGFVHELNNPLDGIIRYVNLAFDHSAEDSVVRQYLMEAKQGLNRIVNIVRALLDFSWNISGSNTFIDINKAIQECLFMAGDILEAYNIKVERNLFSDVPKVPDYRLKIVFTNLIKNACFAMNEKGGIIRIKTRLSGGCIEISFSDTGRGIPQAIQEKIFEPFFTTKNIGEGAGLGLAICCETVKRYEGTISVESKVNEGAVFLIRLPVKRT